MHWDCAVYNLLFKPLELGQLEFASSDVHLLDIAKLLCKSIKRILNRFFFFSKALIYQPHAYF